MSEGTLSRKIFKFWNLANTIPAILRGFYLRKPQASSQKLLWQLATFTHMVRNIRNLVVRFGRYSSNLHLIFKDCINPFIPNRPCLAHEHFWHVDLTILTIRAYIYLKDLFQTEISSSKVRYLLLDLVVYIIFCSKTIYTRWAPLGHRVKFQWLLIYKDSSKVGELIT